MNKPRPGFITPAGLIGLGASTMLMLIFWLIFGNQIFSPGALSQAASGRALQGAASHADLSRDCQACHPAPWDQPGQDQLCLDCHIDVARQLSDRSTLHGAVWSAGLAASCRDCHTEHIGIDANLTAYSGENFPHNQVGFLLKAHRQDSISTPVDCQDCHPDSLLTFAADACTDCHLEISSIFLQEHDLNYGSDCLACHDGRETIREGYPHDRETFFLTGAHLEVRCAACHAGSFSLQEFRETPSSCLACHGDQDPHQSALGELCGECHTTAAWLPAIFDHLQTGFSLSFGHSGLECSACHADQTFQGENSTCDSCHAADDPHEQLFGETCDQCHSTVSWSDVTFDHTGPFTEYCSVCHLKDQPINHFPGECSACHQTSGWLPAFFDHAVAGAVDCQSCHAGDKPSNHYPGQCSFCHNTSAWLPAFFNHSFPLNHGSAGSRCSLCHTSNYASYTCYQCHEHNKSEIRKEHEEVSNLNNCVRCHWDGRKHDEDNGEDDDD